jgi:amino acid transporter/mannitol/fructose-specific phosphotransferase system IIA component (Ntr-type)
MTQASESVGLEKKLNLLDVFCLGAGAMISSGLFVLPGIAFERVGPSVIVSYAIACFLIVPAMLVQAELATALPKSGGTYVFIERSLGPLFGTFAGFLNWISIALKSAFALIGLGAIAQQFYPELGEVGLKAVAIGACLLFTMINLVSVKSTGRMQVVLVILLIAILGFHVVAGVPMVEGSRLIPFITSDFHTIIAVSGLVFVSFGGLTKIASVGEEVINPARNLPLGMFLAWFGVSALYLLVVFVTVGTVESTRLSGSLVPVGLSAREVLGPVGMLLVDLAAALAFITTANAGILSASRTPLAMSRDGLLPELLSRTSEKFKTPHIAIILTSASMIAVIALLSIEDLVKTASTIMILLFLSLNIAVLTLRYSKIQTYQPPFKAPFFPHLPVISTLIYGFLIVEMGVVPLSITAGFGVLACLWYLYYIRPRIERESAFVHLVKSVTSRPLQRLELEDELRQISIERAGDEVTQFLEKLENCPVIEFDEKIEASEMYHHVCEALCESAVKSVDSEQLYQLFLEREYESSTVVHPGIAMPVIIIDEPGLNEVLLVRAKEGVLFSHLHQPVKAIFVFAGALDKRNFHLRALMKLAHVIQNPSFIERWNGARNKDQLRDVVIVQAKES